MSTFWFQFAYSLHTSLDATLTLRQEAAVSNTADQGDNVRAGRSVVSCGAGSAVSYALVESKGLLHLCVDSGKSVTCMMFLSYLKRFFC